MPDAAPLLPRSRISSAGRKRAASKYGKMPNPAQPVCDSIAVIPSENKLVSPLNLLIKNAFINFLSSSSRTICVPTRLAITPPRSMSPTITTGALTALANPIFAISPARKLTSAGLPAPSIINRSACCPNCAKLSRTCGIKLALCVPYSRARMLPKRCP